MKDIYKGLVAFVLVMLLPLQSFALEIDGVFPSAEDNQLEIFGRTDAYRASVMVESRDGEISYINLIDKIMTGEFSQKIPPAEPGRDYRVMVSDGEQAQELYVDYPAPYDVQGREVNTALYVSRSTETVAPGTTLTLCLRTDAAEKECSVFVGVYGKNGVLREIQTLPVSTQPDGSGIVREQIVVPDIPGKQEMKIMVLGKDLRPYTEALSYIIESNHCIYVSPDGDDDTGDGTLENPVKSLVIAAYLAEDLGVDDASVCLLDGEYVYPEGLTLEYFQNIRFRAVGDNAVITGKTDLDASGFTRVTDSTMLSRFPEEVRAQIRQYDLKADGLRGYGKVTPRTYGQSLVPRVSFTVNDTLCTNARWPNKDFARVQSVLSGNLVNGVRNGSNLSFVTERENAAQRWKTADNAYLFGYWQYNWAMDNLKITSVDGQTVVAAGVPEYDAVEGAYYFVYNLPEELDTPGEWYIDPTTDILYIYPPGGTVKSASLSVNERNLVTLDHCTNVTLEGLKIRNGLGSGIVMTGSGGCAVKGCDISDFGQAAVRLSGTADCGIYSSDIHDTAQKAISVSNQNWKNLEDSKTVIENNRIYRYANQARAGSPAVDLNYSVGVYIRHNEFFDAPTTAIGGSAFTTEIDYNKFHDVCKEASDMGAIYSYHMYVGAGNKIRNNEFYNLPAKTDTSGSTVAVYLDEVSGGFEVTGNLFHNVDLPYLGNGGRWITFANNIMIDIAKEHSNGAQGYYWYMYPCGWHASVAYRENLWPTVQQFVRNFPINSAAYRAIYPQLDIDMNDLNNQYPSDILFENNIVQNHGISFFEDVGDSNSRYARQIYLGNKDNDGKPLNITIKEEIKPEGDLGFVNKAAGDYNLNEDSIIREISGFEDWDYSAIGNYIDAYRRR